VEAVLEASPEKTDTAKKRDVYCFVCTGNTCRSPMAEALFNYKYADDTRVARSAGLMIGGDPISPLAAAALEKAGISSEGEHDYKNHRSQIISDEIIENSARVICMSAEHAMQLMCAFPMYAGRIAVMPYDIPDPYGGTAEDYDNCLAAISEGLEMIFAGEADE
jgi:protein-tyrosine phosphatase